MDKSFYTGNRKALYQKLDDNSLAFLFSGDAPRRTADAYFPYFANRNFVYMTGVAQKNSILAAVKLDGDTKDALYIVKPTERQEKWDGGFLKAQDAAALSGADEVLYQQDFQVWADRLLSSGRVGTVYLDFDKMRPDEPDSDAYKFAQYVKARFPFITLKNLLPIIKKQRLIKAPCEIEAMRKAEEINGAGIVAMMKGSKPGMYEYEYKALYDFELTKRGVVTPSSQPIIAAGKNTFCIHYHGYNGRAQDGDFILNDCGAIWDNECTDVSRGWPCNGKFSEKQKLLYQCAYDTSKYMFEQVIKPGLPMARVDGTIKEYNFERLKDIGLLKNIDEIGKYMWHGGAHHVGFDVHDVVHSVPDMPLAPGMVFCVDIGIYVEEWGIGFRLEDNCLITEKGCENISVAVPRSIEEIESVMRK